MQISHLLFLQNRTQSNNPSRTFSYRFEQRYPAVWYIRNVSFSPLILSLSLWQEQNNLRFLQQTISSWKSFNSFISHWSRSPPNRSKDGGWCVVAVIILRIFGFDFSILSLLNYFFACISSFVGFRLLPDASSGWPRFVTLKAHAYLRNRL